MTIKRFYWNNKLPGEKGTEQYMYFNGSSKIQNFQIKVSVLWKPHTHTHTHTHTQNKKPTERDGQKWGVIIQTTICYLFIEPYLVSVCL